MKADNHDFILEIQEGYRFKGACIPLGAAKYQDNVLPECPIRIPLKTMNRHGLIAGATGTGKTKTLQIIAEGLSDAGVPVLLMDIKGDLSGLAAKGDFSDKIKERYALLNTDYQPSAYPLELLSLSGEPGSRLKATVTEFGPLLLAKVLELNDNQEGLLAILFRYADAQALPLLDLKDLTELIKYAREDGKERIEKDYGRISAASLGTILRKIVALEQQGADRFFGERSFDINDFLRHDPQGRGIINVLRLTDMQDRPRLFSTFMLQMLAEMYSSLPEEGDLEKPKLVLFIDEAHLIFQEASKALLQQMETIVKLIRSKGVGIFFCTQNPADVPDDVLGQLGLKVQHALRAFTARDRKDIKKTAENYPVSSYYQTDQLLTSLGIGEALITLLNEKGVPTPLAHTFLLSPRSRMDILSPDEIDAVIAASALSEKYNQEIDRESAYEILREKVAHFSEDNARPSDSKSTASKKQEASWIEKAINSSAGKQLQRSLIRTLFGVIKKMF